MSEAIIGMREVIIGGIFALIPTQFALYKHFLSVLVETRNKADHS